MRLTMIVTLAGLFATTLCAISFAHANDAHLARESYNGSPDLPDHVAYRQFLALVTADTGHASHIVADALGLDPHNPSLAQLVETRLSLFAEARDQLQRQQDVAAYQTLCSPEAASKDDLYSLLNVVDDTRGSTAAQSYQRVASSLPLTEREEFQFYIQKLKAGIAYVKTDNRMSYESSGGDVITDVAMRCASLAQTLD